LLILVFLFPIPFGPWWLTIICPTVFCVSVGLFVAANKKSE
jgi:hypothetical protein